MVDAVNYARPAPVYEGLRRFKFQHHQELHALTPLAVETQEHLLRFLLRASKQAQEPDAFDLLEENNNRRGVDISDDEDGDDEDTDDEDADDDHVILANPAPKETSKVTPKAKSPETEPDPDIEFKRVLRKRKTTLDKTLGHLRMFGRVTAAAARKPHAKASSLQRQFVDLKRYFENANVIRGLPRTKEWTLRFRVLKLRLGTVGGRFLKCVLQWLQHGNPAAYHDIPVLRKHALELVPSPLTKKETDRLTKLRRSKRPQSVVDLRAKLDARKSLYRQFWKYARRLNTDDDTSHLTGLARLEEQLHGSSGSLDETKAQFACNQVVEELEADLGLQNDAICQAGAVFDDTFPERGPLGLSREKLAVADRGYSVAFERLFFVLEQPLWGAKMLLESGFLEPHGQDNPKGRQTILCCKEWSILKTKLPNAEKSQLVKGFNIVAIVPHNAKQLQKSNPAFRAFRRSLSDDKYALGWSTSVLNPIGLHEAMVKLVTQHSVQFENSALGDALIPARTRKWLHMSLPTTKDIRPLVQPEIRAAETLLDLDVTSRSEKAMTVARLKDQSALDLQVVRARVFELLDRAEPESDDDETTPLQYKQGKVHRLLQWLADQRDARCTKLQELLLKEPESDVQQINSLRKKRKRKRNFDPNKQSP